MRAEVKKCPDAGQWLRFWDGNVTDEEARQWGVHLRSCAFCQQQLRDVDEWATFADQSLDRLGYGRSHEPARLHRPSRRWGWLAAAAAVLAVFAVGPGRRAGSQALAAMGSWLQVQRIGAVAVSPQQISALKNTMTLGGRVALTHYGSVTVNGPMRQISATVDQLPHYGMPDLWPKAFGRPGAVTVDSGIRVVLRLNVPHVNQLIRSQGGRQLFPAALNEKPFTLYVPAAAIITPALNGRQHWTIEEVPEPSLAVPGRVPLRQVVRALERLPFLPPNLAAAVAQMANWENTLLIPLPGHPQNVTIHGFPAVVDAGDLGRTAGIAWIQHGLVVAIFRHQKRPVNLSQFVAEVAHAVP